MSDQDNEVGRRKVLAMIESIDYAVVTTQGIDGEPLHGRPMAYRKAQDDGDLWFFTKRSSRKAREIAADPKTLVIFSDPRRQVFVSMSGRSEIVDDRATVTALWSEIYRTWFPGGPADDEIVLIRVRAEHAEYWDTPTSLMVYAFGYLKAVATGKPSRAGDVGTVDLA